jgi:transcriptional regulator with XRE-family HTH domain
MTPPPGPQFDPNALFDHLLQLLELKNDAALSRLLEVEAPTISKIRHGKLKVSAGMLLRMHEVSQLSITELRRLMGDRRRSFRPGKTRRGGRGR